MFVTFIFPISLLYQVLCFTVCRSLNPLDVYSSAPSEEPIPEAPEDKHQSEDTDGPQIPETIEIEPVVEVAVDAELPSNKPEQDAMDIKHEVCCYVV